MEGFNIFESVGALADVLFSDYNALIGNLMFFRPCNIVLDYFFNQL